MIGVLLFAHGSPVEEANHGVHELARKVEAAGPYRYVRVAFLDCAQPDLPAAVATAVEAGMHRVVVVPYFLTVGLHLQRDLPRLIATAKEQYPHLEITVGRSLEGHPLMASMILSRVQQVLEGQEASGGRDR